MVPAGGGNCDMIFAPEEKEKSGKDAKRRKVKKNSILLA